MYFENILGNSQVKQFLEKAINENHILHSYLFIGIDGIGKRLFANEFAKKILCIEKEDEEEKCESCIKWNSLNHPDFLIIEPDNKTIKIEQIRNMQEKISEKPIVSNKKVYIINDSDTMTIEAQNCLLKTLEEPPEYACIILISSNESKLLNTIKSRCMKIQFNKLSEEDIIKFAREKINMHTEDNFIKLSEGSIGRLINIQENIEVYKQINTILDNVEKKDFVSFLNESEVLYKEKDKIAEILEYINIYFLSKIIRFLFSIYK